MIRGNIKTRSRNVSWSSCRKTRFSPAMFEVGLSRRVPHTTAADPHIQRTATNCARLYMFFCCRAPSHCCRLPCQPNCLPATHYRDCLLEVLMFCGCCAETAPCLLACYSRNPGLIADALKFSLSDATKFSLCYLVPWQTIAHLQSLNVRQGVDSIDASLRVSSPELVPEDFR